MPTDANPSPRTRHFIIDGTDETAFSILACTDATAHFLLMHPDIAFCELDADELADAFRDLPDRFDIAHNDIINAFPPDDDNDTLDPH